MTDVESERALAAHRSPPIGIVALVFVVLFASSIVANMIMTHGAPYPTPYRPIADLQAHYTRFSDAVRLVSLIQFSAVMPFAVVVASLVSRLRFFRIDVAGVTIALVGGVAATVLLGVSSLSTWVLSQPGVADDAGALRAIQLLAFATGGVGHTATLGLLLAGLSVPALAFDLLPRWVSIIGLVLASVAMLSILSMVAPDLSLLLPLARFPAYLWLMTVGFALPVRRPRAAFT